MQVLPESTRLKQRFPLIISLKQLRNYNRKLFGVRHKNRREHNQHFKLLFFKINLHFFTPNQISTYGKQNFSLMNSNYLVFFTPEIQR